MKYLTRWEEYAPEAYNKIRSSSDDIGEIAKNTGWLEFQIHRIKNHLFYGEHQLDDGVRCFDPDPDIADAWMRLSQGQYNYVVSTYILLYCYQILSITKEIMAFYVLLLKEKEDNIGVIYRFGPDENDLGLLWLDKSSGVVKELKQTSVNNSEAFFQRAAVKIRQHWKAGDFPEKTCWAS